MLLTDIDIDRIIKNNCGDPPLKEKLEFTIWLNEDKLQFYTRCPLLKGQEHADSLDSYRRLIMKAKEVLYNTKAEL